MVTEFRKFHDVAIATMPRNLTTLRYSCRSNEDEDSKYFLRTKSANETLLRAQEIRTESFTHLSPTDVNDPTDDVWTSS